MISDWVRMNDLGLGEEDFLENACHNKIENQT